MTTVPEAIDAYLMKTEIEFLEQTGREKLTSKQRIPQNSMRVSLHDLFSLSKKADILSGKQLRGNASVAKELTDQLEELSSALVSFFDLVVVFGEEAAESTIEYIRMHAKEEVALDSPECATCKCLAVCHLLHTLSAYYIKTHSDEFEHL